MAGDDLQNVRRWTAKRRHALVLRLLRGETSAQEAARKLGLTAAEVEEWKQRFLDGAQNALRSRPRDEDGIKDAEIRRLKQKVGELVVQGDILREAIKPYRPTDGRTFDEQSCAAGRRPRPAVVRRRLRE